MQKVANDFVITIATVNGSGSQSSNNVLLRSLFRMGIPVGGKNLFPSNIAGLPTWFTIRANSQGFTARKKMADIVVAMNSTTVAEDLRSLKSNGFFFYNSELKLPGDIPPEMQTFAIPFRDIVSSISDSPKLKKLLTNMIYVGVLAELLNIPQSTLDLVLDHQFGGKAESLESNRKAIRAGLDYAKNNLSGIDFPYAAEKIENGNSGKILIDGNSSAALGAVFGGCTFVSWYPITPSSSVVESFMNFAEEYRRESDGSTNYAVVQAEDELASISMVVGAGWAGARAMTATSGPGLSLMGEAAGLAYYAEIPAVIWNIQRVGPSTGLPTRTMQGDLLSAYYLSHGDTKHVVLLPGSTEECFAFAQTAHDLSEQLQTLVIVLSDLDLGMNLHMSKEFAYPTTPFNRGKVLNAEQLENAKSFQRYKDLDGDGIGYRTLPGTEHPLAAYFTRGTGHDEASRYSEDSDTYKSNMQRLSKKFAKARTLVPQPIVEMRTNSKIGIISFGSSEDAVLEARHMLMKKNIICSHLRLRALPLADSVSTFIKALDRIYVIEQNRDAQLLSILRSELPELANKLSSVLQFDGLPLDAEEVFSQILKLETPQ